MESGGLVGPVGIEPTTEDYELGAIGRTGLVASDWSEKLRVLRPVDVYKRQLHIACCWFRSLVARAAGNRHPSSR